MQFMGEKVVRVHDMSACRPPEGLTRGSKYHNRGFVRWLVEGLSMILGADGIQIHKLTVACFEILARYQL